MTTETSYDHRAEPGVDTEPDAQDHRTGQALDADVASTDHADAVDWLEDQFPGWSIEVAATATLREDLQPIWIAHKDGHHPQSELSAAKLHTRLSEYLERRSRVDAMMN